MELIEGPIAGSPGSTHLERTMPTNNDKLRLTKIAETWNTLTERNRQELSKRLTTLELSALNSWAVDCFQSFDEIYFDLLEQIGNAEPNDVDLVHDKVVDIYWKLDHIKNHIKDAEQGFSEFMNLLAKKAEGKEKNKAQEK